jgi:hypothetical protein
MYGNTDLSDNEIQTKNKEIQTMLNYLLKAAELK